MGGCTKVGQHLPGASFPFSSMTHHRAQVQKWGQGTAKSNRGGSRTSRIPKCPLDSIRRLHMPRSVALDTKNSLPGDGSKCSHVNFHVYSMRNFVSWVLPQQIKSVIFISTMNIKITKVKSLDLQVMIHFFSTTYSCSLFLFFFVCFLHDNFILHIK